eukprot:SAG11_NODE_39544_length_229_cov_4.115385_1_plen_38_part_10
MAAAALNLSIYKLSLRIRQVTRPRVGPLRRSNGAGVRS